MYAGIRDNKDLFTDLMDNVYLADHAEIRDEKTRCDEIIAREPGFPREVLINLMVRLFPRMHHLYQHDSEIYHSPFMARRLKRICSPDLFDVYFRLSMQSGNIPAREFETILALAANAEEFDHALARLNQDNRIIRFLNLFDYLAIQRIPKDNIPAIINALVDNGDLFPPNPEAGLLSLDTPMRIYRIIHALLQRISSKTQRLDIMKNAINHATKSIYIIVYELREQSREHHEDETAFVPVEYRDFTPEELNGLKQLCVEKIKTWAHHHALVDYPYLLSILYAWREWGSETECRDYVSELTNTDPGLVSFLTAILDEAINQAMTRYEKLNTWDKHLDSINNFIAPEKLVPRAEILFEDEHFEKLREREQLALLIFLDLMKSNSIKKVRKTTVDTKGQDFHA